MDSRERKLEGVLSGGKWQRDNRESVYLCFIRPLRFRVGDGPTLERYTAVSSPNSHNGNIQ